MKLRGQALEEFESKGINIHEPRWGASWDVPEHTQKWYDYNQEWRTWTEKNRSTATIQNIIDQTARMTKEFHPD